MLERSPVNYVTTFAAPVGVGDTTVTLALAPVTGLMSGDWRLVTVNEIMLVTAVAGSVCTVTRAAETLNGVATAQAHMVGEACVCGMTGQGIAALIAQSVPSVPVTSVFARTGDVVAEVGDYSSFYDATGAAAAAQAASDPAGSAATAQSNAEAFTLAQGYITGNQTITLSGDASGSGATGIAVTLASVIVAAGPIGGAATVPVITYDAKGRLTAVTTATVTPAAIGSPSGSGTSTGTNTGDQTSVSGSSGSCTGNAATATALATGRTIAITGDLAYTSPSFDGSGNVTAVGTLATVNSNVGSFTYASVTVDGKGRITAASSGTAPPAAANPSASVGLAAVNGSAGTFMTSDSAPALNQAIVPTWTGAHAWGVSSTQAILVQDPSGTSFPNLLVVDTTHGGVGIGIAPSTTYILAAQGFQPASTSVATGTAAQRILLQGAQGGNSTRVTGTCTGGLGGRIDIFNGSGGVATAGTGTNKGGASGPVNFGAQSAGGASTAAAAINATGGAGGAVNVYFGASGGSATCSGSGAAQGGIAGSAFFIAGTGGAAQSSTGPATGGFGTGFSLSSGAGGAATGGTVCTGGAAQNFILSAPSGGNASGGTVSNSGGAAGAIQIYAAMGGTGATANGANGAVSFGVNANSVPNTVAGQIGFYTGVSTLLFALNATGVGWFATAPVAQQANASQAAITAVTDANAQSSLQAIYNLLHAYGLAPATA